jgi:nucleotide-binding universal stress UspA family protein
MTTWQHILCPVDFSDASHRALEHAIELATRLGSELLLAHFCAPPESVMPEGMMLMPPTLIDEELAAAQKTMAKWKAEAEAGGCTRLTTTVVVGMAGPEIVRLAKEKGVDLIVMGTHGRSGFDRLLLGSVAEIVVRRAPCPVLTIRSE